MFQNFIYGIWILLPLFFFLMALWSKLEQIGGKKKQERPGDFFSQGLFVLGCVLVSFLIETQFLASLVAQYSPSSVPLSFYQVLLLPLVLTVAAKVIGPSKTIRIEKTTDLSKKRAR